ncbi:MULTISPECIES: UDP-3-O-acyl-N-acetylglucosamine deacetylase [unclassified Dysgonomonas]|uniref:UDP-3-O-acyl-N-acetylglucosamine deacetylase n=1 Tax=unclassified Dysgonomonas TaxID=2630389 RepID=UPI0006801884|nr:MULTISPECIES: UDP-3-O-acyl-N-acetylglucosamine deacetylase [unclassified Dysgonomonas]MBD8347333.1 UDP-3-O-acyl-N-acetylglucosamine deacetylase [Dysgonomonas sp. HGC4]MBF0576843.1 UDP-3-O-acyl-N-acetylglucosamine deacetylase [Dysgonomonas sp. GY617]
MTKQRTLKQSFSLEGKGLHTGINGRITFNPAPDNHGYKIRRTDVDGQPIINALAENVTSTARGTVLSKNGVQVRTVEHALAALYACEIDNCLIDIDGPEFPILDGSSTQFVRKIKEIGVSLQQSKRIYVSFPRKRIKVIDEVSESSILLLPDDHFNIECHIAYDSILLKRQDARLEDISDFTKDFAPARTFVFVKEIEQLLKNNLIKGGDLDNSVIIYDQLMSQDELDRVSDLMGVKRKDASKLGYLMNKPLLFANEPARHKLVDIIGDVALVGYFIKGKIVANCPGHHINNMFARAIRKQLNVSTEADMNIQQPKPSQFYWNHP